MEQVAEDLNADGDMGVNDKFHKELRGDLGEGFHGGSWLRVDPVVTPLSCSVRSGG